LIGVGVRVAVTTTSAREVDSAVAAVGTSADAEVAKEDARTAETTKRMDNMQQLPMLARME
jgi:hypothetical protein